MNYVYERNPDYETWIGLKRKGNECCKRWAKSFKQFMEDMGERPSPSHVLARKKPGKPFSPSNCKWMTRSEQALCRRPRGTHS